MRGRSLKKLPAFRKRKRRSYGRKSVQRTQSRSLRGQRRPRSRYGKARVMGDQALLPLVGAGLLIGAGYLGAGAVVDEIWG